MLICIIGSLAMLPAASFANDRATAKADSQNKDRAEETRKTLMTEATSTIEETQRALRQLDEGKKKEALAALERATGKLEIILARDSRLTLAPAGVNVVTYGIEGGLDVVKQASRRARNLIDEGRLQEARWLMRDLASETVVSVSNIPLATYPAAIKEAVKLIDRNNLDEAKHVLQTALDTQVVTETVIPLPVIDAAESLKAAEALAEKKGRTQDENAHLKASLDKARGQLELAQALGYGKKSDFEKLYQQLKEIEQKTADNKFGTGFFAKIKASIEDFLKSSQPAKH